MNRPFPQQVLILVLLPWHFLSCCVYPRSDCAVVNMYQAAEMHEATKTHTHTHFSNIMTWSESEWNCIFFLASSVSLSVSGCMEPWYICICFPLGQHSLCPSPSLPLCLFSLWTYTHCYRTMFYGPYVWGRVTVTVPLCLWSYFCLFCLVSWTVEMFCGFGLRSLLDWSFKHFLCRLNDSGTRLCPLS